MKRPSFQFYPGDWQRDAALRSCSVGARGLWIEMMCIMHQADPYGVLVLNDKAIGPAQLARMVGASEKEVGRWLGELTAAGVHSVDDAGRVFSRRMVRDEALRNIRAEGGKGGAGFGALGAQHGAKGGRPAKVTGDKQPPLKPPLPDPLKPPPSSSSSSSSSGTSKATEADASVVAAENPSGDPPADKVGKINGHKPSIPACPHEKIIALYHELCPTLDRVKTWTGARESYSRQRWRETAERLKFTTEEELLGWFREMFECVAMSDFLTGKVPPRGADSVPFKADLEWLLRPKNFPKIIEGRYWNRA